MANFKWDHYSDQPEVIRDKAFKKKIYRQTRWASIKLLASNIVVFPIAFLAYWLFPVKKSPISVCDFFGMSINLDKNPQQTKAFIDDLQVENLLIRMPLSDIDNLQSYLDFASQYKDKKLLINILQDRQHIEDLTLLKQSLDNIFSAFSPLTQHFQIGNAINRKKWAFFSMDEYLRFYQVAYQLKKQKYPDLTLLGSSVIDFEYYFTIRTLFNLHKVYFDQCSSLLYVDRRGAPENTQMGLNLTKKLHFLQMILRLSPKSGTDILITETNWPISHTAPYAPTSEKECVSLDDHANYLVRYYLLALASGVVKTVYWHQLIAPGYGLIDNRQDKLLKYPAYYAFKTLLSILKDTEFLALKITGKQYKISFQKLKTNPSESADQIIDIYWGLEPFVIQTDGRTIIQRDGVELPYTKELQVNSSPVYLINNLTNNSTDHKTKKT